MGRKNTASDEDLATCQDLCEEVSGVAGRIARAIESGGFNAGKTGPAAARRLAGTAGTLAALAAKLLAMDEIPRPIREPPPFLS